MKLTLPVERLRRDTWLYGSLPACTKTSSELVILFSVPDFALISTHCRTTVTFETVGANCAHHSTRVPMPFRGVMTSSLTPTRPDDRQLLDTSSVSVVIVPRNRDLESGWWTHESNNLDARTSSGQTTVLCILSFCSFNCLTAWSCTLVTDHELDHRRISMARTKVASNGQHCFFFVNVLYSNFPIA